MTGTVQSPPPQDGAEADKAAADLAMEVFIEEYLKQPGAFSSAVVMGFFGPLARAYKAAVAEVELLSGHIDGWRSLVAESATERDRYRERATAAEAALAEANRRIREYEDRDEDAKFTHRTGDRG